MATRRWPPRQLWAWCAAAGILLGIGIGCRMDLLVYAPPVLITIGVIVRFDRERGLIGARRPTPPR